MSGQNGSRLTAPEWLSLLVSNIIRAGTCEVPVSLFQFASQQQMELARGKVF